ncbi:hypothetical protein ABT075_38200 [Streptomyces sp. NPDC002677]|uniref:hypothetical protein n=1 Tax=Streptomyces sp. NPDC002677 TaxID=3154774 RepID=UPI00331BC169
MAQATTGRATVGDAAVRIEEHDRLVVLRSGTPAPAGYADVDDIVRVLRWAGDPTVTLLSDPGTMARADFWPRLSGLLDSLRASGRTALRLAMAGTGGERPGHPALARRIADGWGVTVEAPAAAVHTVPGGSLYAPGGWLGFAPGAASPVPIGARCPRPAWEVALDAVPGHTAGGHVIERIPAGLLLRPARAPGTVVGDLYHTVPLDPRRLTVVVGGLPGDEVAADDVAGLLSPLPEPVRDGVRLAPGCPGDLLPLAQHVADRLGAAVVAATGLPLLTDGPSGGTRGVRSVVLGADGAPGWLPFVNAAECHPDREPRLLGCAAPLPGADGTPDGAVRLTDRWWVTVTRAGLWVGAHGAVRSGAGLAVGPEGPVVEAGVPGERPDHSLWPALERLLGSLPPQVCASATLQVYGTTADDAPALRELATRHGVRTQAAPAPAPAPAASGGAEVVPYSRTPVAEVTPAVPRAPADPAVPRTTTGPVAVPAVPRTAADPVAAPDLAGAWEHLIRGREELAAPRQPVVPDPPAGPDLDEAWEYLSRRPTPVAASAEGPTPRPGPPRLDATESVRPALARSSFRTGHRSSPAEHTALRLLAGPAWERHAPAVARALGRLPAMADAEREAAEADLTALRLHLDEAGGLLDHHALAAACHGRDDRLLPFAACLVSALRRLPTHRGAVLRGAGSALPHAEDPENDPLRPGTVLRDRAPLSGVRAAGGAGRPPGPRYAIWSVTGRLARPLFHAPDGPEEVQEVVFAPGTPFMILDVRRGGPSPVVLLRELPASGGAPASAPGQDTNAELGEADRAALAGLDEALRGRGGQTGGGGWPERCAGPVGEGP